MEQESSLHEFLVCAADEFGLHLIDKQIEQFMLYLTQLIEWNKITNLTSITEPHEIVIKHFIDSIAILSMTNIPVNACLIDVGAGAGFPGIPIKIARNDISLILIEPVKKKSSFLQSICGQLKLEGVSVFSGTIQQYVAQSVFERADIVTVRALRFKEIVASVSLALKDPGRIFLFRSDKGEAISKLSSVKVMKESRFSLPLNYGSRIITELSISAPSMN